ncbi:MAG: molybdopterin-dependent oxidoreductase [Sphaerochaetaceae bacterium]|nr:molybdopterin-dependent oxidoreductase [Sphaerochaetaceae bacterium]
MTDLSQVFTNATSFKVGVLYCATRTGHFTEIKRGEDNSITVIDSSDFDEEVTVIDDSCPVFPKEEADYPGQPLLAVFGDDHESVDLYCKKIQVAFDSEASQKKQDELEETDTSLIWSYGDADSYFSENPDQKFHHIKSTFNIDSYKSPSLSDRRTYAFMDGDTLRIKVATQWPLMIKREVARAMNMDPKKVIVHTQEYYAPNDQLLNTPLFSAIIAAKASVKTSSAVVLTNEMASCQPAVKAYLESVVDEQGNPLAFLADAIINAGAFASFRSELCLGLFAGMVPPYDIKAMKARIRVFRSHRPPANIFSDAGYSLGLSLLESHYGKVAKLTGTSPDVWRLRHLERTALHDCVKDSTRFDSLEKTIEDAVKDSWFSRQYAVNNQDGIKHSRINPFIDYSRGIGLACGEGNQGFSYCFKLLKDSSITVTMEKDRSVTIRCGVAPNSIMLHTWSTIVSKVLNVDPSVVLFEDINAEGIVDIGPSALSRDIRYVSSWILQASKKIKERLDAGEELPVTVQTSAPMPERHINTDPLEVRNGSVFDESEWKGAVTGTDAAGSAVVALSIDPVLLTPRIDRVWISLAMGRIINRPRFLRNVRQTAANIISEICPSADLSCRIELDLSEKSDGPLGSATSLVRGLVSSALLSALSQALSASVTNIPVTAEYIASILESSDKEEQNAD